jgi:hypothetical protein
MPFCRDEEECEGLPMPAQDAEECEALPMPTAEEDAGGEISEDVKAWEPESASPAKPNTPMQPGECREDPNHHHHYSGCPFTGQPYPTCPGHNSCPGMKPEPSTPPATLAPGTEEPSEPAGKSALRKVRRFKDQPMREDDDDLFPFQPEVDTMEFRASDGQLYDFGPGVL